MVSSLIDAKVARVAFCFARAGCTLSHEKASRGGTLPVPGMPLLASTHGRTPRDKSSLAFVPSRELTRVIVHDHFKSSYISPREEK